MTSLTSSHCICLLLYIPGFSSAFGCLRWCDQTSFIYSPLTMARLLYRMLRVANMVGNFNETKMRAVFDAPSFLESVSRLAEMDKPLSYALPMTGNAMSPLFNTHQPRSDSKRRAATVVSTDSQGSGKDSTGPASGHSSNWKDTLVIRRLNSVPQSLFNRVHVNDVVVVQDPGDSRRKYVRRIAALEGAEMVSDLTGDTPFRIPTNHCWVLRDNLAAIAAPDSTFFGPLNLKYVIGRVMYAIHSATDHGRVTNSPYAMASDAIVLTQEPVTPYIDAHGHKTDDSQKHSPADGK